MSNLHPITVAVIPARGGSERMAHKNLIKINGKPLLAYTLEHCLQSKELHGVYVSSDDDEILSLAEQYKVNLIKRPNDIAGKYASSESAILHAIDVIEKDIAVDAVMMVQCTSPIRKSNDIDRAIRKFYSQGADSLLSVVKSHRFIWKERENNFSPINYDYKNRPRSQDMAPQYIENGSFYISKTSLLKEKQNRLGGKISIYEMTSDSSAEIDTYDDLLVVKKLLEQNHQEAMLEKINKIPTLIIYDFDGVMTNNKAILDQTGKESVQINRSDGLGVNLIRELGIEQMILSTEENTVVARRAEKLKIPVEQGCNDKGALISKLLDRKKIKHSDVAYVGNDVNDLEAMEKVGLSICPSDSAQDIINIADIILSVKGGDGCIRELSDILKMRIVKNKQSEC